MTQVGGHPHTIVFSPDNALVFKPTSVKEIAFYQSLNNHLALRPLLPFTPQFLGTLRLKAQGSEARESVVLTNVLEPFTHPSILDVKLGTVLYDDDAPEDKKERMKKVAEETTSGSCGLRLVGFSVRPPPPFISYPANVGVLKKPAQAFLCFFSLRIGTRPPNPRR